MVIAKPTLLLGIQAGEDHLDSYSDRVAFVIDVIAKEKIMLVNDWSPIQTLGPEH